MFFHKHVYVLVRSELCWIFLFIICVLLVAMYCSCSPGSVVLVVCEHERKIRVYLRNVFGVHLTYIISALELAWSKLLWENNFEHYKANIWVCIYDFFLNWGHRMPLCNSLSQETQKLSFRGLRNPDWGAGTSVMLPGVLERLMGKLLSFLQTYKVKAITTFKLGRNFSCVFPKCC